MMSLELKQPIKLRNLKPLSLFVLFQFLHWHVKGFSSERIALKVDVLKDRKLDCLQARRPCVFQPGNFTGWGSGGVKDQELRNSFCEPVWPSGKAVGSPFSPKIVV